jgi:hypothetical protein
MTEHHDHRDDCPFKFATLDVCDCVEKNMLDRIEALTKERDAWKEQHTAEALGLHAQMRRAEAAEAKLAQAVDWFETIRDRAKGDYMAHTYYLDALAALATIKRREP